MKRWVFVLVVGAGFLLVTLLFSTEDPNLIKCGGKIMSPGDVCETTKNGRTTGEDTYAEMKAAAESRAATFRDHGIWMAGVGVALTGLGATMLIRGKRRKATAVAAAGQDMRPPFAQQPGFPPQQGNPQQYVQQFPPQQPQPQSQPQLQPQPQPQSQPQLQPQWQAGPPQQPYPQQGGWPQQPPQGGSAPQQFGPPPQQQQQFGPQGH
ncbi:hypothetical protein [Amycolatopsis pittospori]|uniref:hypothetical protein n=1 Tax=Amycolatopsis pittospori TaxID=2749434 RepID=UPI0015F04F1B|nr:hypothetical protein [Amycolatopsis pittospori]